MAITELIPPDELARDPIRMDELRQGKIVLKERQFRRKDGSLLPVEISARMLPGGHLLGHVRDITKRKRAERALRDREQRLRLLTDNMMDVISQEQPAGCQQPLEPANSPSQEPRGSIVPAGHPEPRARHGHAA